MKIVLLQDVAGIGRKSEVKEVSDGFARNFLLRKNLAQVATKQLLDQFTKQAQETQARSAKQEEETRALANKLSSQTFRLQAKTSKDHLFAAVHEQEIASTINSRSGTALSPKQIIISEPIKQLGLAEIELKLSPAVKTRVKLNIEPLYEKK